MKGTKKLTIWPLPGGRDSHFQVVLDFLAFISKDGKPYNDAKQWFPNTFSTVNGEYRAGGYLDVLLRQLGLVKKDHNENVKLTLEGREVLYTKSKEKLYQILDSRIVGISEIIRILKQKPSTVKELFEILKAELKTKWEKTNQLRYRLGWLISLQKIEKQGNHYHAI